MTEVHAAHEKIVRPHRGDAGFFGRRTVDGAGFANDVVVADDDPRRRTVVGEVLRLRSDRAERGDDVSRPDSDFAGKVDVADESRALAEDGPAADHAIGAD